MQKTGVTKKEGVGEKCSTLRYCGIDGLQHINCDIGCCDNKHVPREKSNTEYVINNIIVYTDSKISDKAQSLINQAKANGIKILYRSNK